MKNVLYPNLDSGCCLTGNCRRYDRACCAEEVRECAQCGNQFTPAARARPVLLGPLPDDVERRARRRGRGARRRDRLVRRRDDRGSRGGSPLPGPGTCPASPRPSPTRSGGSPWSTPPSSATTRGTTRAPWPTAAPGGGETEQTLEGLRYVRNQLGRSADPAELHPPRLRPRGPARLDLALAAQARPRRPRAAGAQMGAEPVPRLPGSGSPGTTSRQPSPGAPSSSPLPPALPGMPASPGP